MGPNILWLILAAMYCALAIQSWRAKKNIEHALNFDEIIRDTYTLKPGSLEGIFVLKFTKKTYNNLMLINIAGFLLAVVACILST